MAERLAAKIAAQARLDWSVRSCGVAADLHYRVPEGVRKALAAEGVAEIEHRPQLVGRPLLGWADLALAMTAAQVEEVLERFPEFGGKVRLLNAEAGLGGADIADPMGRPDRVFADCCRRIRAAVEALARAKRESSPGSGPGPA